MAWLHTKLIKLTNSAKSPRVLLFPLNAQLTLMAKAGSGNGAVYFRELRISVLARSIREVSSEARYIRVVDSLSWPMPSEITLTGTPLVLAAEAQLWRATYSVKGIFTPVIPAIFLRLWFML